MVPVTGRELERLVPLTAGWEETMIWSVLQGCMGRAWADRLDAPAACLLAVGDFCFFAGTPKEELVRFWPEGAEFLIAVPRQEGWSRLIEEVRPSARRAVRYAFAKDPAAFDRRQLERYAAAPEGCTLHVMDGPLYHRALGASWSRDLCSQFADEADWLSRGLGVCALVNGELAAGAASYTVYQGGIEIEIDTRPDLRRRGLARCCGARLILECLDRGLYPSWDAQNPWSASLAGQLGYRFSHTYPVYELERPFFS